jgi:hypothetical protein
MDDEKKKARTEAAGESPEDVGSLRTDEEGMSTATARLVIEKKLRAKIMQDYDLLEVENKGRYYAAKAYSKDGSWLNELLIDKQSGAIQVVNRMKRRGAKER